MRREVCVKDTQQVELDQPEIEGDATERAVEAAKRAADVVSDEFTDFILAERGEH